MALDACGGEEVAGDGVVEGGAGAEVGEPRVECKIGKFMHWLGQDWNA